MTWQIDQEKRTAYQAILLHWYPHGRRRFRWRDGRRNAYQIFVAEIMLRKTDAAKVAKTYDKFITQYPDPETLACADDAELREAIKLLGIADRARLLKASAIRIVHEHGCRIPRSFSALVDLPGVGPYIANAVLCFAYRRDVPLLDTNVIRVIDRVFSVRSDRPRPRDDKNLWEFAATLVPAGQSVSYNRAVLDLAASICTASRPKCAECPLNKICDYAALYQSAPPVKQGRDDGKKPAAPA